MKERMDAYASRLIEELQECPGTWRKPWASLGGHRNHFTGRHYHGGNVFRCMLHNMVYGTPRSSGSDLVPSRRWDSR